LISLPETAFTGGGNNALSLIFVINPYLGQSQTKNIAFTEHCSLLLLKEDRACTLNSENQREEVEILSLMSYITNQ